MSLPLPLTQFSRNHVLTTMPAKNPAFDTTAEAISVPRVGESEDVEEVDCSDGSFVTCNSMNSTCANLLDTERTGASTLEVIFSPHVTAWAGDDAPEAEFADDASICDDLVDICTIPTPGVVDIQPGSGGNLSQATREMEQSANTISTVLNADSNGARSFLDTAASNAGTGQLCLTFSDLGACWLEGLLDELPRKISPISGTATRAFSSRDATASEMNVAQTQANQDPPVDTSLANRFGAMGSSGHGTRRSKIQDTWGRTSDPGAAVGVPWLKFRDRTLSSSIGFRDASTLTVESITRASTIRGRNEFANTSADVSTSTTPIKREESGRPMARRDSSRQLPVPRSPAWPREFLTTTRSGGTSGEQDDEPSPAGGAYVSPGCKRKVPFITNGSTTTAGVPPDTVTSPVKKARISATHRQDMVVQPELQDAQEDHAHEEAGAKALQRLTSTDVERAASVADVGKSTTKMSGTSNIRYPNAAQQHSADSTTAAGPDGRTPSQVASNISSSTLLAVPSGLLPSITPPRLQVRSASTPGVSVRPKSASLGRTTSKPSRQPLPVPGPPQVVGSELAPPEEAPKKRRRRSKASIAGRQKHGQNKMKEKLTEKTD